MHKRPLSEMSQKLYAELQRRNYDEGFCFLITQNLNTDFTANRMLGYLRYYEHPSMEDITDEMLAILSDRERIMQKKEAEFYQGKINEIYAYGLGTEEDDE